MPEDTTDKPVNAEEASTAQSAQELEERTFTQAEVDKIVQKRIARVEKSQAELEKSIREKVAAEQDEAAKLESMTTQQKKAYEAKKKDDELAQLKQELTHFKMRGVATDILAEKGISSDKDVLDFVCADTAEETQARIEKFAAIVDRVAGAKRKAQFTRSTAPAASQSGKETTDKDFKRMSYQDRAKLKQSDPDLYMRLVKQTY